MAFQDVLDKNIPALEHYEELYRSLHQDPELSCNESETAAIVTKHLEKLESIELHKNVGGHGVVGVLKNGSGPTVLLRADMDALPMPEKTGLPYASKKEAVDIYGKKVPVMHSCGHDMQ